MFWIRKKVNVKPVKTSRVLDINSDDSFVPPKIVKNNTELKKTDFDMVKDIQQQFVKAGVIDDSIKFFDDIQSVEEINEIMADANDGAKNEKDFHSQFYDEDAITFLDEYEQNLDEDFDNPVLDGLDDYGRRFFEDMRENKRPNRKATSDSIVIMMPDGSIVTKEPGDNG